MSDINKFLHDEHELKKSLCGTEERHFVTFNLDTDECKHLVISNHCRERDCINSSCVKERENLLWFKYRPLLDAIRIRTVRHIIVTHPEIPASEYTKKKKQHIRSKFRSLLKRMSRSKYYYWGIYGFEDKYRPDRDVFTPHIHMMNMGYTDSQKKLTQWWTKILGVKLAIVKVEFRRDKYSMFKYIAKRVASGGLVEVPYESVGDKPFYKDDKNYCFVSMGFDKYSELVKSTRLFQKYGKYPTGVLAEATLIETKEREKRLRTVMIPMEYFDYLRKGSKPPDLSHYKAEIMGIRASISGDDLERFTESRAIMYLVYQNSINSQEFGMAKPVYAKNAVISEFENERIELMLKGGER